VRGSVQGQGVNGPLNQTGYAQAAGVGRMKLKTVDIASVSYSDQVRTQESAASFIRGYHGLPCSDDDRSIPASEQADMYSISITRRSITDIGEGLVKREWWGGWCVLEY